jgi:hypothetical protein
VEFELKHSAVYICLQKTKTYLGIIVANYVDVDEKLQNSAESKQRAKYHVHMENGSILSGFLLA